MARNLIRFPAVRFGGTVRDFLVFACAIGLTTAALPQQPAAPSNSAQSRESSRVPVDSSLKEMFEAKIKAEWEAIKNKDKKTYGELLADDYQGVEVDTQGERTKIQALAELAGFVIYEVTLQFPPRSVVHFSRFYVTELWVKRDGQWKELHYQETHVK
jgi:hypothetical protein